MKNKQVSVENLAKVKELRSKLEFLCRETKDSFPKDAKAIVVFGSGEIDDVTNKVAETIINNGLKIPVYICGDGRKLPEGTPKDISEAEKLKILSTQKTEAERFKNDIIKKLAKAGIEYDESLFILDKESKSTEENARNVKVLLKSNGITIDEKGFITDKIVYINTPVLSMLGQLELVNLGISNLYVIGAYMDSPTLLTKEKWINGKFDLLQARIQLLKEQ